MSTNQPPSSPLCIIPARGGSKRLPRKNMAEFHGKPMLAYTVDAALASGLFDAVNVSTEDEEIARVARSYGATIPYLRGEHLAGDRVGVVDVCIDMIDHFRDRGVEYEILCVLLPTSPLRTAEDIVKTYNLLVQSGSGYAMAVTSYLYSPIEALVEQDGYLVPFWERDPTFVKRQDRPKLCVDSGAVYVVRIDAFLRDRTFYGPNLVGYRIPAERGIDVDDSFSFLLAELLMEHREKLSREAAVCVPCDSL